MPFKVVILRARRRIPGYVSLGMWTQGVLPMQPRANALTRHWCKKHSRDVSTSRHASPPEKISFTSFAQHGKALAACCPIKLWTRACLLSPHLDSHAFLRRSALFFAAYKVRFGPASHLLQIHDKLGSSYSKQAISPHFYIRYARVCACAQHSFLDVVTVEGDIRATTSCKSLQLPTAPCPEFGKIGRPWFAFSDHRLKLDSFLFPGCNSPT